MTKRRKFLLGMGSLAAGGAAAMGSGAFTSVQADRDFTVEVADDDAALLAIEPSSGPNGQYAEEEDGKVAVDLTSNDEVSDSGINDRAFVNFEDVLTLTNQGTQAVGVQVEIPNVPSPGDMSISGPVERVKEGGVYELGVGDSVDLGFFFNLDKKSDFGDIIDDVDTITIIADADLL